MFLENMKEEPWNNATIEIYTEQLGEYNFFIGVKVDVLIKTEFSVENKTQILLSSFWDESLAA